MAKYKAEIRNSNYSFDNIYRATIQGCVKAAKKELDSVRSVRVGKAEDISSNAEIVVYEGKEIETPAYTRKTTVIYSNEVYREKY